MSKTKILIIDGQYTILSNGVFVQDEIPRLLASYMDEGYSVWMVTGDINDTSILDSPNIPIWLKSEVMSFSPDALVTMRKSYKFDEKSLILSNDYNRAKSYGLKLEIYSLSELLGSLKYEPLEVADAVICYGFDILEFIKFCKESKLLGIVDSEKVNTDRRTGTHDGVAFMASGSNAAEDVSFAMECISMLIKNGEYKIRHHKNCLGVTYQGKGVEDVDMTITDDISLPLLLV